MSTNHSDIEFAAHRDAPENHLLLMDCGEAVGTVLRQIQAATIVWHWSICVGGAHGSGSAGSRPAAQEACLWAWLKEREAMGAQGWIALIQHNAEVAWRSWEWEVNTGRRRW